MKHWLSLGLGALAVVIGALWTLQGLGHVGGSAMTGERVWAVVGPIVALAGLVLVGVGFRSRRHRPGPAEGRDQGGPA